MPKPIPAAGAGLLPRPTLVARSLLPLTAILLLLGTLLYGPIGLLLGGLGFWHLLQRCA